MYRIYIYNAYIVAVHGFKSTTIPKSVSFLLFYKEMKLFCIAYYLIYIFLYTIFTTCYSSIVKLSGKDTILSIFDCLLCRDIFGSRESL